MLYDPITISVCYDFILLFTLADILGTVTSRPSEMRTTTTVILIAPSEETAWNGYLVLLIDLTHERGESDGVR
jgi:hypothetical protein